MGNISRGRQVSGLWQGTDRCHSLVQLRVAPRIPGVCLMKPFKVARPVLGDPLVAAPWKGESAPLHTFR
jgi:hypothetical protein